MTRFLILLCCVSTVGGALHAFVEHSDIASEGHAHVHHDHVGHEHGEDERPADTPAPHDHQVEAFTAAKMSPSQHRTVLLATTLRIALPNLQEAGSTVPAVRSSARSPDLPLYLHIASLRI